MSKAALAAALFLAAVGTTGTASATSAAAANGTETNSVLIRYHPSQLATSRGARVLYGRIDSAAQEVCDDTGELFLRASFSACERSAIADAVAEVDDSQLTAVYNEHFPSYPLAEATSLRLIPAIIVIVG